MEGKFNKHSSDTLNMEWKDNKHSYVKDKNKEHSKDAETVEQKYDKGSIVKDKGNNSSSDTLSVEEKDNFFKVNREKKGSSVTKIKYLFQRYFAISQNWFKLDPVWVEEIFMTRDTDFLKIICQKYIPVQSDKYWVEFYVKIGSAK